jgi:hypothetical protein
MTMQPHFYRISTELPRTLRTSFLGLIQNGDDDTNEGHTSPALRLQTSRTELIVKCNEVRPSEIDVLAICRVNASAKKPSKVVTERCIVEKGIVADLLCSTINSGQASNLFSLLRAGSLSSRMDSAFPGKKAAPLG